ncbi:UPF0575 protein C19orf67 homolog [Danio aesculapii]|uniref:UPF0575 protein C19orf67 homolog n=1 Tax=Danio aesculapii TaxID=1142201 RepID=UPI0024BF4704|nr:UPF0575 protein C19orf67 homolog [Danio aesculapii]
MANVEHDVSASLLRETNEVDQSLTDQEAITETMEENTTIASSFGDGMFLWDNDSPAGNTPSCGDTRIMEDKISRIEKQLQYLLNKADEFQTQLVWSRDCVQDYGFGNIVPMFLETCQPYFSLLESTARNSNPFCPPQSTNIRTQLLQFSQQLCSRLEQLVLLFASFSFCSLEESDPLSVSHFSIGQCQIDNMKVSIFRYCCPTPFLASSSTGLYKRMRWNVEREIEAGGEGKTYDSAEFYFLCCEDVIEAADDQNRDRSSEGESTETDSESKVSRIWSIGRWVQTYPDPNTEDTIDWVLCSLPCGQYKQLLCLGNEEPSSCTATDCLLGALLSQETHGTFTIIT